MTTPPDRTRYSSGWSTTEGTMPSSRWAFAALIRRRRVRMIMLSDAQMFMLAQVDRAHALGDRLVLQVDVAYARVVDGLLRLAVDHVVVVPVGSKMPSP